MSLFVPYRKQRGPKPAEVRRAEEELAAVTRAVGAALETEATAMDVLPERGAVSFRDTEGRIWVVTVQRSDVAELICEADLRRAARENP